ncbi:hypothetical protein EPUL_002865, partial [Erysiphe pulchra]
SSFFRERAVLSSRNDEVDKFNDNLSHLIGANYHSYYSLDTTQNDQSRHVSDYTPEFLRTVSGQGLPPGKLTLHVGMPVMLLRNYYSREGLINGCRLIITRLYNHCVKARITSADPRFDGNEHIISRINLSCDENLPFTLIRKQLPLRPCYAMTINKSQGQTLKYAGVDLITPVFSHGQLVQRFFVKNGIDHENSPPYEHELNGVAERFNRKIVTKARAMLLDLPRFLWAEVTASAVYLYNRIPHRTIENKLPIELLYGIKSPINNTSSSFWL